MKQIWSVKALVGYLKLKLDNDLLIQNITVEGELSNFNYHNQRHMYFTLKDESSRISCVMFARSAAQVKFTPKDGMKVKVSANVSIFEAGGTLQLYVNEMEEAGLGNLSVQFEKLKNKLQHEGLFDNIHKKEFNRYPRSIGVISGRDSAALNDILTTLKRRWPIARVTIYNSLVQGNNAHEDLIKNLLIADRNHHDSIIIARGGGSIEDLWAFNHESLARVIFDLKTPIVSGVGHEIDFTITDFVSDLRAPTPTAAAELITPDILKVKETVVQLSLSLQERIQTLINNKHQLLYTVSKTPVFIHPEIIFSSYQKKIQKETDELTVFKEELLSFINNYYKLSENFTKYVSKIMHQEALSINQVELSLFNNMKQYQTLITNNFVKQIELLDSYSPINTLKRGYSIVEQNGRVQSKVSNIKSNEKISIRMSDGIINATIIKKEKTDGKF